MYRVLYLAPGTLHDRRYLTTLSQAGYEVLYVHLLNGAERFCPEGVRRVHLGYTALHGEGFTKDVSRMLRKIPLVPRVHRIIREFHPDILQAVWIPTLGFWAALSGFRPLVMHCFGTDVRIRARKRWWIRDIVRYTLRRTDAVTCDNRHTSDILTRDFGVPLSRIHCFPFGVDLGIFRADPEGREKVRARLGWENARIVIHTRALEPLYDPMTFLRAVRALCANDPRVRALMAGEGTLSQMLRKEVSREGLETRVRFLGDVPQEELAGYLNASDVLVSCPHDDGSANSVLEAMACGRPVVASDLPAMREWTGSGVGVHLCRPGDASSFSAAILRVFSDDGLREREGKRNIEVVSERADRGRNRLRFLRIYDGFLRGERTLAVPGGVPAL